MSDVREGLLAAVCWLEWVEMGSNVLEIVWAIWVRQLSARPASWKPLVWGWHVFDIFMYMKNLYHILSYFVSYHILLTDILYHDKQFIITINYHNKYMHDLLRNKTLLVFIKPLPCHSSYYISLYSSGKAYIHKYSSILLTYNWSPLH